MGKTLRLIWTWISHLSTGQWLASLVVPAMTLSAVFKFVADMPVGLSIAFGVLLGLAVFIVWQARAILRAGKVSPEIKAEAVASADEATGRLTELAEDAVAIGDIPSGTTLGEGAVLLQTGKDGKSGRLRDFAAGRNATAGPGATALGAGAKAGKLDKE